MQSEQDKGWYFKDLERAVVDAARVLAKRKVSSGKKRLTIGERLVVEAVKALEAAGG